MPYLILSDIHANREALEAVLEDATGRYDRIVCLGDIVGYGADPNYTAEWVRSNVKQVIRGNHDKVCVGLDQTEVYNPAARASTEWTSRALERPNAAYLAALPRGPVRVADFDVVHGSPLDEDEYLIDPGDAAMTREALETPVTFFGHTHVQGGFLLARRGVRGIRGDHTLELEKDHLYLLNPGSVGQPRDSDPRAAYAIYTPETRTVEFRRTAYDIRKAARKILEAGLPQVLGLRLFEGV